MQSRQTKPTSLRMPEGDQRRFTRFEVRLQAYATAVPDTNLPDSLWYRRRSQEVPAFVSDLGAGGLFFLCEISHDIGTHVWVSLLIDGKTLPVRGMVRRQTTHMREGRCFYGHGIQFIRSDFANDAISAIMSYLKTKI